MGGPASGWRDHAKGSVLDRRAQLAASAQPLRPAGQVATSRHVAGAARRRRVTGSHPQQGSRGANAPLVSYPVVPDFVPER